MFTNPHNKTIPLFLLGTLVVFGMTLDSYAAGLPRGISLGKVQLVKNGAGSRKSTFLNLYEGGLYLAARSNDADAIIGADEPMAIAIDIKSGFVSQSKMAAALETGFQNSTNGQTGAITDEIREFKSCFAEEIKIGDRFMIVYMPSQGVVISKNGTRKGTISGLPFKQALFGIWLGSEPADSGLKAGMLGQ